MVAQKVLLTVMIHSRSTVVVLERHTAEKPMKLPTKTKTSIKSSEFTTMEEGATKRFYVEFESYLVQSPYRIDSCNPHPGSVVGGTISLRVKIL